MLLRICLIAALLAGLFVGGLNFTQIKQKITDLTEERNKEHSGRVTAETQLASTRKELDKTTVELKTTKQTLAATTEELNKAQTDLTAQTKRGDKLADDLKKTTAERDDAQANLAAYKNTGYSPEQIVGIGKQYKDLQGELEGMHAENKILGQNITKLKNQLAPFIGLVQDIELPANLKGKVLVTDPKWNFVVVSVGMEQGALEHADLLVNRNGKLVAKVKITSVQKDRCVANVLPGWQMGEVLEGDQVIPAHPAS
jgi:hypothetical protein